ncbi:dnaJ homolog subfamily C member 21 [Drosophila tropicalis]|uniref:dnaJ homolog subfamily C member 21 n=1 Tax=Drosophila tropicalis TaxID=46794 RepID=UPI0035ABD330
MRCYYEELCIPRESNDSDIKTAYRKLALKWHPDKNPDCLAEAKEKFQLIQQAYEVLSDAQERAWYDNHREQILRGRNSEYSEKSLDVFQFFTSSCYKGYGNDDQSFYSVYREVFVKIALEDQEFTNDLDGLDLAPEFGYANSSYEDVVGPFYAYWQAYTTKKTYEWLCPYDVREIKERFILRKVEKEMKKIVQAARKDRSEEVRNLVSFVRKRDLRVQAYRQILEERAEANRLKQEEKRKEQLRKRQQELAEIKKNKVVNEGYEEQLKQLEQQYGSETDEYTDADNNEAEDGSDDDSNADDDNEETELEYVDDLYCVACNKSFKNAKARANHEESKKHRENVERLCEEMENEEDAYQQMEESLDDLQLNSDHKEDAEEEDAEADEIEVEEEISISKRNKKCKKSKKVTSKLLTEEDIDDNLEFEALKSESENEDDWNNKGKKSAKKTREQSTATKAIDEIASAPATKLSPAAADSTDSTISPQHTCVTCRLAFDSKNKLFAHLKKTNHGVYIPKDKPVVEGKPPKTKAAAKRGGKGNK